MAQYVPLEEMPGQDVYVTTLYKDVILDILKRRVGKSDAYFDEVTYSEWDCAPDKPSKFEERNLLSDEPVTEDFQSSGSSAAQPSPEFDEYPDTTLNMVQAIEERFSINGETFTYKDVADLSGHSLGKGTVKNQFNDYLRPDGFVQDKGGRPKEFQLIKSWKANWSDE